jgi:hypothetical protein
MPNQPNLSMTKPLLVPEAGDEARPTIQVVFVKPDPNDPRFRDDDPPRQIEQRPYPGQPAPPGTKLLPSPDPNQRPMRDLSKPGSWMD